MQIEKKEFVTLTKDEKTALKEVYTLMIDILNGSGDSDTLNITQKILDDLDEFKYILNL